MREQDMKKILEMGVALSSERDLDRLLERILNCVMELARCDAGTLYLLDSGRLHFKISRNDTLKNYSNGEGMPPVPLDRNNVCAFALLEGRTVRIDDVYDCKDHDFSGPRNYDARTGYRTQSMLVVPMRSREGADIGVLQLINAIDDVGEVCPFAPDMALVLESVASQAAITIQNVRYLNDIKELFQSFVRVMSAAIDERSPYNVDHSRRMAANGARFADWLNARTAEQGGTPIFSPQRKEELVMSIWLHDIGKVTTPLDVMDKAKRLSPLQTVQLNDRLRDIRLIGRVDCLEGRMTEEELEAFSAEVGETARRIDEINCTGFVTDEQLAWLDSLRGRTYTDADGKVWSWLTDEEHAMLSIRKGTLSPEERKIMENHVVVTDKLLSQIRFSPELSHIREWAAAHHEKLNGKGYPKGLKGDEIPFEVRMITILDIFDALVADDRPYKPGKPVEDAIRILGFMVKDGELDPELTTQFIQSRCWEAGEGER